MDNSKMNIRDALKRMGKIAVAATVASVAPVEAIASVRKMNGEAPIGYNSFGAY